MVWLSPIPGSFLNGFVLGRRAVPCPAAEALSGRTPEKGSHQLYMYDPKEVKPLQF